MSQSPAPTVKWKRSSLASPPIEWRSNAQRRVRGQPRTFLFPEIERAKDAGSGSPEPDKWTHEFPQIFSATYPQQDRQITRCLLSPDLSRQKFTDRTKAIAKDS